MAAFYSLPEDIVGEIYALLDGSSRRSFRLSCQAVRAAPSVLHQISRAQVTLTPQKVCHSHPLKDWPRGAKLRSLEVKTTRSVRQAVLEDDGHLILGLLQPYHPGMRCRVTTMLQDVQELTLKGVVVQSGILACLLGELMASLPCLKLLRIVGSTASKQLPINPSLFDALSDRACALVELDLSEAAGVTWHVIQAVSRMPGLRALSFDVTHLDAFDSSAPQKPAVFVSLQRLEVCGLANHHQAGLNTLLTMVPCLQCLAFERALALDASSTLPPSLKEIRTWSADADVLSQILHGMVLAGLLPSLQLLRVGQLRMRPSTTETVQSCGSDAEVALIRGALACTYQCWPCNPGFRLEVKAIDDVKNFMVLTILCASIGSGANHVRVIRMPEVSTSDMTGFRTLADICPNLTSVFVCISEDNLEPFFDAVQFLPKLEHLQVIVCTLPLRTGFGASLVALCTTAAMTVEREKHLFLEVVLGREACVLPDDDDDVADWLDQVQDEVDAFNHAWPMAMFRLWSSMKTRVVAMITC